MDEKLKGIETKCPICGEDYEMMDCPNCMDGWPRTADPDCPMCKGSGVWGDCRKHDLIDREVWKRGRIAWWWYRAWPVLHQVVKPIERCSCGKKVVRVLWWRVNHCDCEIPF